MTDPSQSSPARVFVRTRFVELRTATCMVDLKKRLPEEWVGVVEPAVRELMVFEDVFSSSMSTREVRDESICATCAEVFGEQFLIRVALERQIVDTTVRFIKRLSLLIVENVVAQLSAIEPERKRDEVALCLLQSKAEVSPTRFASWLDEYEQTTRTAVAESG